jgi:hypothetical protein
MLHCVTASRFFASERGAPASKDRGEARKLLPFYMHFSQPDVIFHDALQWHQTTAGNGPCCLGFE